MIASTFSGVHDFFHSSTWYVIRNLAIFYGSSASSAAPSKSA